ncbi:MAG: HD domain-containing protein [Candidatus Marinimicrobia bacterium]|jgi:3'-5' exoribonuclease|nr:HD domain-containing protein [Candidatus Neomarinimicrobiota bacterium]MBT3501909.1 HD domain-containing protein [Candidatus Neomarinimicrobiota bacterium]MBT3838565.1 HD domain-containing protein [Candidatus Neomarinimicrobiota bacterium]MBT3999821.1 HD domain-containing protein [Candidatus Neomarinimicrobiota bacterium]MBT4281876.1 HD domain-containing protein [Candidatus Neomarinimicrobiota bacterium]
MKKSITPIEKFKEGDSIQGFYLCVQKHLRHTRSGDLYLDLELRDVTGHISAKIWDGVPELSPKFEAGDAVVISGDVESFMDRPQLVIRKINKATVQHYSRYGFDPALVVPTSKKNPAKMWMDIESIINSISNKYLQTLVSKIYRSNKKKLMIHPASVKMHHNFRSGFLEHILSMANIANKISSFYDVDRDLVLAGVFLHDIGKLKEINSEYEAEYTEEGNLIGHIVIGRDLIKTAIGKIKDFPEDLSRKIEHIILSHQGKYEWHSPKLPSFPEALLVHLIDNLDAKMNLMDIALSDDPEPGRFTNRHNYFRIPLLKKDESK